ncbi:MAG: sugar ABC transporter substrate-binding protein [Kiritimatiellia bacterium]|nr:sugar ABC transporter substrate-binding protein [Lentisphaerota bacterium]
MFKFTISMVCMAALLAGSGGCGQRADRSDAGTTLVVWAHEGQPAEKAALQSVIEAFNRSQTSVAARLEFKQEQGYGDRVNAAAMAGQLPDILEVDGPYTAHFADLGVLQPLNEILPPGLTNDFLPTILQQGSYQDKLYTLGAFDSTVALFYDRARLAACGITPPQSVQAAWTWDEFMAALAKISEQYPDLLPLETFMTWGGEWLTYAFLPVVWSNGGRVLAPDGRQAEGYLNGPATVAALRAWQQLFQRGYADPDATPGMFQHGQAAMALGVFNRWPIFRDAELDFGMSPYPGLQSSASPSGSWCWGVTARCRDTAAAAELLQWLLDPRQGLEPLCRANGGVPSRAAALALMPDYQETRGLFVEQLRLTGRARPATPRYGTVTTEVSRALDDIARGADVQQTLDGAARRIDAVLRDAGG